MKEKFDFEEVGKQVPYTIPEGFFERMQEQVMHSIERPAPRRNLFRVWAGAISAAAAIVVLVLCLPVSREAEPRQVLVQADVRVDAWMESLPDEELESISDFAEDDVFMYE